jgi:hypothetical protein
VPLGGLATVQNLLCWLPSIKYTFRTLFQRADMYGADGLDNSSTIGYRKQRYSRIIQRVVEKMPTVALKLAAPVILSTATRGPSAPIVA